MERSENRKPSSDAQVLASLYMLQRYPVSRYRSPKDKEAALLRVGALLGDPMVDEVLWQIRELARAWFGADLDRPGAAILLDVIDQTAHRVVSTSARVLRQHWEDEQYRTHLRRQQPRELSDRLTEQGLLPIELPVETLRYFTDPYGVDAQGWDEATMAERAEFASLWAVVHVRLEVRARLPRPGPRP